MIDKPNPWRFKFTALVAKDGAAAWLEDLAAKHVPKEPVQVEQYEQYEVRPYKVSYLPAIATSEELKGVTLSYGELTPGQKIILKERKIEQVKAVLGCSSQLDDVPIRLSLQLVEGVDYFLDRNNTYLKAMNADVAELSRLDDDMPEPLIVMKKDGSE